MECRCLHRGFMNTSAITMPKMCRSAVLRAFFVCTCLSTSGSGIAGVWYEHGACFWASRSCFVNVCSGHGTFSVRLWILSESVLPGWHGQFFSSRLEHFDYTDVHLWDWEASRSNEHGVDYTRLAVPAIIPVFLVGASCLISAIRNVHRHRVQVCRRRNGFCTACGYDLRGAATYRCSECGASLGPSSVLADCRAGDP
jgi:hypothetical protein